MIDRNSHSLLQTVTGGGALSNGELGVGLTNTVNHCGIYTVERDRKSRCKLTTCKYTMQTWFSCCMQG